jgi:hypothetical protein
MEMTQKEVLLWLIELGTDFVDYLEVSAHKFKNGTHEVIGKGTDNWTITGDLERIPSTYATNAKFKLTEYALDKLKDTYGKARDE